MSARSVLVFPAGMPPSLAWARHATGTGIRVVGASSLAHDPARDRYSYWTSLPWVGDSGFAGALHRCLDDYGIDTVFTPHPVVWSVLRQLLPRMSPDTRLEPGQPWATELADYRAYLDIADHMYAEPLHLAASDEPAPSLSRLELAALVRAFQSVPGQCGDDKLEALAATFRHVPQGDMVEIGTLWGRSAVALAFLAGHYGIGALLCVDPWRVEEMSQGVPQVDAISESAPMDDIFEAFQVNLTPFAGNVNYLRTTSQAAAAIYAFRRKVVTDFGGTVYTGKIALLHIDGNHALASVRSDIAAWKGFLRPGGWVVFDDYCWPFGKGPRTAADEFLLEHPVETAFVAGEALFVRIAAGGMQ